jgi:Host cell surface-exposed lipoprotein
MIIRSTWRSAMSNDGMGFFPAGVFHSDPTYRKRHCMKRIVLVVVAAITAAVAPRAVASASSHKTTHKTVSLSGGQSVSVTCSGKSLSVTKSGNVAALVCASRPAKAPVTAPPATAPPVTAPPVTTPALTQQQKSAVASAKQYLSLQGFSQQGLIAQLDSPDGGGYSVNDATVAVDSLTVNWNAEAVQSAKAYLKLQAFSCSDLIQQLDSPDGDQYTVAQATYGATQAGDC